MSGVARLGFFTRRGDARAELQDCLLLGPLMVAHATGGPMTIELDLAVTGVVAVLDGMGGHAAGRRAAMLGASELGGLLGTVQTSTTSGLKSALVEAGRRVVDESALVPEWAGMGTTVAGVRVSGGALRAFNVGDARTYLLQDGYLCQHSTDDVVGGAGRAGGDLTQCLGAGMRDMEPHVSDVPWSEAPVVLLCTDGLHRHVEIRMLEQAVRGPDPIVALWALAAGARDDVGVVLVDSRPLEPSVTSAAVPELAPYQRRPEERGDVGHERRRFRFRAPWRPTVAR